MFVVHNDCDIHPTVKINVKEGHLGAGSIVREGVIIEGTRVCIGREAYIDRFSVIGGGSCFDPDAFLEAGDWLHMGWNSQVNTACGVKIGHEVGLGIETKLFTHGAYIDSYNLGAPVGWQSIEIGNNVWLPNAWVNPGVKIGDNVVVAARSLININLPSGSSCAGIPVRIIKENAFPRRLRTEEKEKLIDQIFHKVRLRFESTSETKNYELHYSSKQDSIVCRYGKRESKFGLRDKVIDGYVTSLSRIMKDQLRRNGIRFRYGEDGGIWVNWNQKVKVER